MCSKTNVIKVIFIISTQAYKKWNIPQSNSTDSYDFIF